MALLIIASLLEVEGGIVRATRLFTFILLPIFGLFALSWWHPIGTFTTLLGLFHLPSHFLLSFFYHFLFSHHFIVGWQSKRVCGNFNIRFDASNFFCHFCHLAVLL
ncbi:membrane protein [Beggiatoa sp. PS]|nr:membrane protein [Beggiatoa sp. PS]